jgi:hypothetical protein
VDISFGVTPVFLTLAALIAAAASYLTYRGTTPPLSSGRRAVLATLRFVSLSIILFLLFEPILARLTTRTDEPILAVLIDTSESMQMEDPGTGATPAQQAVVLADELRGTAGTELRYFGFDSQAAEFDPDAGGLDSLEFSGQRTDVSSALEYVRSELSEANLGGILILSDGRYTAGRNPRHAADDSDVPIFTIVLGDSSEKRDIRISRVTTNEITYAGVPLPVDVGIASAGFAGSRLAVTLSVGDSTVGSATLEAPPDGTERTTNLTYTPASPGLQQITVTVTGLEGEATYRNNVIRAGVRVLDRRRRVLLVGSGPDPDVASIRQVLEADENNEVTSVIQRGGGGYYGAALPTIAGGADVIVLAGFPGVGARLADVRRLAEAIEGGVPAFFVLTRQSDLGLFGRELSTAFGTSVEGRRRSFFEAVPVPTPVGRRHPILHEITSTDSWSRLPPVFTNESAWSVSADMRVLATVRVRGIELGDPLLAIRSRPGSRTAVFLGAGTWRLANLPEDLQDYAYYWPNLLANVVQWISAAEDDRTVRVQTTEREFAGGDPVQFIGQVYDESLNPVADADVSVVVTAPTGDDYRYTMDALGSGRYVLDAGPLAEGNYRFSVTANRAGAMLGEDSGSFVVGNLALEFRNPVADPLLMRQVALRSGGTAFTTASYDGLMDAMIVSGRFQNRVSTIRRESELWRRPIFLVVVLLCLATEWVVRKRSGLS